jgi:Cu/Ag efflux protein CusF
MHKACGVFATVAALGLGSAFPADSGRQTTGTIKSINQSTHRLTLQNGERFNVAKTVDLGKLKPGDKVTITFSKQGDMMDVSAVEKTR